MATVTMFKYISKTFELTFDGTKSHYSKPLIINVNYHKFPQDIRS